MCKQKLLHLTMFFIDKVRMWRRLLLLTMKNIAKVANPLGCERWRD
ncbi:hypothetical protein J2Z66_006786 [Paenibacillus eucommiae]|uniref:Uncharacterized protein n=1 Tax=Paenibacillus eucommiae TaxID=1355755 RepID=A0ABS4J8T1_9BACL|nr:hypothetical protein [Paenibacillus eucommiae]